MVFYFRAVSFIARLFRRLFRIRDCDKGLKEDPSGSEDPSGASLSLRRSSITHYFRILLRHHSLKQIQEEADWERAVHWTAIGEPNSRSEGPASNRRNVAEPTHGYLH